MILAGQVAVVTGAASGIGNALARGLAAAGVELHLPGRNAAAMATTVAELASAHPQCPPARHYQLDLAAPPASWELPDTLAPDLLIHCAGEYSGASILDTRASELEALFRVNVSAPLALTQRLLPALEARKGQVVFINSSVTQQPSRQRPGAYTAVKKAGASLADSVRDAVNATGVRVLSVYPGRTATPMQQRIYSAEQRDYQPDSLLQSTDVCSAVLAALTLPRTAEVTDLMIRPLAKS